MEDKMKILLDKINIGEETFQYFNDAKILKIKVNPKAKSWNILIEKEDLLPVEILQELEEKKNLLDENAKSIEFIFEIKNKDLNVYKSYYDYYLLQKLKKELKVLAIYQDCMKIEEDRLILVVSNEMEKESLEKVLPTINKFYKQMGYNDEIEIEIREEENVLEKVQAELLEEVNHIDPKKEKKEAKKTEETEKKQYRREAVDENNVIGRGIKEDPIKIKTIIGEDNNVVIEAKVFGTDFFESPKTDFKIITVKLTDYSDSIYAKIFVRDNDEYKRLSKEFKEGNWYKIRGASVNDKYS